MFVETSEAYRLQ